MLAKGAVSEETVKLPPSRKRKRQSQPKQEDGEESYILSEEEESVEEESVEEEQCETKVCRP